MPKIQLGNRIITKGALPYLIAEIGVNHEGSIELAKRLIELAKEGGADAAKFQSYKAETLASRYSPSYWDLQKEPTTSQYELFKKYDHFGEKEYRQLAEYCQKCGLDFLCTPFDDNSINFLLPLMPFYKIASADITNLPFLRKISRTQKPIVLSTGASTLVEIDLAVRELRQAGSTAIALLHCVLNYPTKNENAHLNMINSLQQVFPDLVVGYSDHTLPDQDMLALTTAFLKGALIIEKHFTHDKTLPGNDHYHAMDVDDLKRLRLQLEKISTMLGLEIKQPLESEEISRSNARRSIIIKRDVKAGTLLTEDDLTYKRPAFGLSPLYWDQVIGCKAVSDLKEDQILTWADIEKKKSPSPTCCRPSHSRG